MTSRKLLALCTLGAFTGAQADAVPPPPPRPDMLATVQSFIEASIGKDLPAYAALLSDKFIGSDGESTEALPRAAWLANVAGAFSNKRLRLTVLHVVSGSRFSGRDLQYRVLLLERMTNCPFAIPECYTSYQTETLVIDGYRVSGIVRSMPFDTELSNAGKRTDIPDPAQSSPPTLGERRPPHPATGSLTEPSSARSSGP